MFRFGTRSDERGSTLRGRASLTKTAVIAALAFSGNHGGGG